MKLGEVCGVSVSNKELAVEVTRLKIEIRNLKAEIQAIKAVKDKEVKRQREGFLNMTESEDQNVEWYYPIRANSKHNEDTYSDKACRDRLLW